MKTITSLVCVCAILNPFHLPQPSQVTVASAEPVTLSIIGIAVGLAGIASDVYGMTREGDVAQEVSDKVAQVTINQLKIGLSPLKELNPKLQRLTQAQAQLQEAQQRTLKGQAQLKAGQQRLLRGQAQLRAGQQRLLAGQAQLKAGQAQLQEGQVELSSQLKLIQEHLDQSVVEARSLLRELRQDNLREHHRTQSLVIGLQEARYGAALKLIDLAGKAGLKRPQQAQAWFNEALTALLETQSYFERQRKQGAYVSREYSALIHLSLATCYLGLGLFDEGAQEVARLVSLPSTGESLKRLAELSAQGEGRLLRDHSLIELRAWSASVQDEARRLAQLKARAVKLIKTSPELSLYWGRYDNAAYGRAQLAERELALQAYATLLARSVAEAEASSDARQTPKPPLNLDPHKTEELETLKRVARALKEVRALNRLIKRVSKSPDEVPKSDLTGARQVFQRVSAEADPQGELSQRLKRCTARAHPTRSPDCQKGETLITDLQEVLVSVDRALDQIEQAQSALKPSF